MSSKNAYENATKTVSNIANPNYILQEKYGSQEITKKKKEKKLRYNTFNLNFLF